MAEPAEDVEKKKRKKFEEAFPESAALLEEADTETETKINRMVGPLRRSRPEVYQALSELEKQTGKKKTVIVSEALQHYLIERKIIQSQLSVADLWEAFDLFSTLQEQAIKNFIRMGSLLFSEEYQGMLELSRTLGGGVPVTAPKTLPPKARGIADKLVEKIWKFAEPLLDWALEATMRNMAKAMGAKAPLMPKGEKIPVEIIEEEE